MIVAENENCTLGSICSVSKNANFNKYPGKLIVNDKDKNWETRAPDNKPLVAFYPAFLENGKTFAPAFSPSR